MKTDHIERPPKCSRESTFNTPLNLFSKLLEEITVSSTKT